MKYDYPKSWPHGARDGVMLWGKKKIHGNIGIKVKQNLLEIFWRIGLSQVSTLAYGPLVHPINWLFPLGMGQSFSPVT